MKSRIINFGSLIFLIFFVTDLQSQRLKKIASIPLDSVVGNRIHKLHDVMILGSTDHEKRQTFYKKVHTLLGEPIKGLSDVREFKRFNDKTYRFICAKTIDGKEKFGIKNLKGEVVIDYKYDELKFHSLNYFLGKIENERFLIDLFDVEKKLPEALRWNFKIQSKDVIYCFGSNRLIDFEGNYLSASHDFIGYDTLYPNYYRAPKYKIRNLYHLGDSLVLEGYEEGSIRLVDKYIFKVNRKDENQSKLYDFNLNPVKPEWKFSSVTEIGFQVFKQYKNGRTYGLVDFDMNILLPTVYSSIWVKGSSFIRVKDQTGYSQLLDIKGKEMLPGKYVNVSICPGGFMVRKEDRWNYWYDKNGKEISPVKFKEIPIQEHFHYHSIENFSPLALPVRDWEKKEYLIAPHAKKEKIRFKEVRFLGADIFAAKDSSDKVAIVNYKGEFITDYEFDLLNRMNVPNTSPYIYTNLIKMKKNDNWGILHTSGKVLFEPILEKPEILLASEKIIWLLNGDFWEVYEFEE